MKRCGKCGKENANEMRFCLECGNQLPDAPIFINLQNDAPPNQSELKTDNFGQSVNTQVKSSYTPPDYSSPAGKPRRKNTKIFLVVGGILALLLLLFTAVAAIVVYNMISATEKADLNPTPTPAPTRSTEKESPTPKSSATPKTSPTAESKPVTLEDSADISVKFDGVDVDYNVTENSRPGMRMRVNFTVTGMKEKDGYLAIHFQTRDGEPLIASKPGEYRDVKGNLAAFRTLRPDYDETLYKDLELFLPYDEIDLPAGKHDLRMDFDLLDDKGVSLEHLAYENFWYEEK